MTDTPGFDVPYQTKYLEGEDKREQDVIKVRCNKEERALLDEMKLFWNVPYDSTALKLCLEHSRNVVHGQFSESMKKQMTSKRRNRLLE